jgi:ribosome biogenesis GTPase
MITSGNDTTKYTGVVYKKTIGNYFVNIDGRSVLCSISTKLRRNLLYPTADPNSIRPHVVGVKDIDVLDPVAVGDRVNFIDAQDGNGMIVEVLPRKNKFVRRSAVPMPGAHPFEQVIVANIDQVLPVMSAAQPSPKWNLLDRYLASAESLNLPSLICITKIDLVQDDDDLDVEIDNYRRIGYQVILTSATSGVGLEELKSALANRISVFCGKSGVGKTTLLNALQPGLGLRVNTVNSNTGKGKHTTTNLEMVALASGGSVVDTPGMREFGLWEVEDLDLAELFPEMRPLIGRCKFGMDCSHNTEPGCAIRTAVSKGKITERRFQSFLRIRE